MAPLAILVVFVCALCQHPSGGNWGQNIGSYQGVIAYSNGQDTGKYSFTEPIGQDGKKYQCVEYCRRFYRLHYGVDTSGWEINADDWYVLGPYWGLQRFANNGTSLPQPGDILCFNTGSYGHVAIVTSVDAGDVNVIQQNASAETAYGQVITINGIVQGGCQGWLRKKGGLSSP